MAWRNLWRNPRRTLIGMAAIALGYAMLLLFACLLHGLSQQMIENGTRLGLSHMQIHAPDYYPDRSLYHTLGGKAGTPVGELLARIIAQPHVQAAAPRVYGYGLVSSGTQSAGAELRGIDPVREQQVSRLHTRLAKGRFLNADSQQEIVQEVVLGEQLANTIAADLGTEIVLLTQAADGSIGNDVYRVVGLLRTGFEATDRATVLMSVASLQGLLSLPTNRIHEVGVIVTSAAQASGLALTLESQLTTRLPVRVRAWPELSPALAEYVRLSQSTNAILFFIVFLVAIIGVMNTMLMAVFERTRELGVLMALGLRPVHVVGFIVLEACFLAGVSLVFGGTLGAPLLWYLEVYGLDLRNVIGDLSIAGVVIDPIWYGRHDLTTYMQAAIGLACVAVVSALYPALRAARFRPVEAMRRV
jgi:ABC-type lipoprotein release transport system permease subunit